MYLGGGGVEVPEDAPFVEIIPGSCSGPPPSWLCNNDIRRSPMGNGERAHLACPGFSRSIRLTLFARAQGGNCDAACRCHYSSDLLLLVQFAGTVCGRRRVHQPASWLWLGGSRREGDPLLLPHWADGRHRQAGCLPRQRSASGKNRERKCAENYNEWHNKIIF